MLPNYLASLETGHFPLDEWFAKSLTRLLVHLTILLNVLALRTMDTGYKKAGYLKSPPTRQFSPGANRKNDNFILDNRLYRIPGIQYNLNYPAFLGLKLLPHTRSSFI